MFVVGALLCFYYCYSYCCCCSHYSNFSEPFCTVLFGIRLSLGAPFETNRIVVAILIGLAAPIAMLTIYIMNSVYVCHRAFDDIIVNAIETHRISSPPPPLSRHERVCGWVWVDLLQTKLREHNALGNFDTLITPQMLGYLNTITSIAKFGNHNSANWDDRFNRVHSPNQSSKENVSHSQFYCYCYWSWCWLCCCSCCYWYHIIHISTAQEESKLFGRKNSMIFSLSHSHAALLSVIKP